MALPLCSNCEAWRIHPNDRFCGYCGESTLVIQVKLAPQTVYFDGNPEGVVNIGISSLAGKLAGGAFLWRRLSPGADDIPIADNDSDLPLSGANHHYQTPLKKFGDFKRILIEWDLIHRMTPRKQIPVARLILGQRHPEVALEQDALLFTPEAHACVRLTLMHRGGGAVKGARLSVDAGEAWREHVSLDVPDETFVLEEGSRKEVELRLSSKLQDFLAQAPFGIHANLIITVPDLARPIGHRLRIYAPIPAIPLLEFVSHESLKALASGIIHASVRISNRGGEGLDLPTFQAILSSGNRTFWQRSCHLSLSRIESGETRVCQIAIPLDTQDDAIPEGTYRFTLRPSSDVQNNSAGLTATTSVSLVKRAPYGGIIAIDFGTTASAASCFNYRGEPTVIQLADQQNYIPTAVCYYLDPDRELCTAIGFEAQRIRDFHVGEVAYFDNLKWRLAEPQEFLVPNDETRTFKQVAVDYLGAVKKTIENHPAVLAEVDRVCICQPARFDPRLSLLLIEIFRAVGMEPQIIIEDPKLHAISESWPSAVLCIPSKPLQSWQRSLLQQVDVFNGEDPLGKRWLLLNFDMGGGSTDFSLMTLDIQDYAHIEINEVATDGDNEVAGNFLAELLAKHIDFDRNRFPFRLPWKESQIADPKLKRIMTENGFRLLDELIFPLQKDDGYLVASAGRFQNAIDPRKWTEPALLNKKEIEKIQDEIAIEHADVSEQLAARKGEITLLDHHGFEQRLFFAAGLEPIVFDFQRFIETYIACVSTRLYSRLCHLVSRAPARHDNFIFLITGRGGLFPLVRTMIDAYAKILSRSEGHRTFRPVRINADHAKNIVSSGACYIKTFLQNRGNQILFQPLSLPRFGMIDGIDRASGDYLFRPIISGMPRPEDGWIKFDFPCAPSTHEINITFCYGGAESFVVKLGDNFIGTIRARVRFDSALAAKRAILLLRATDEGIDLYIATPPDSPGNEEDFEIWQRQSIGRLSI